MGSLAPELLALSGHMNLQARQLDFMESDWLNFQVL